MAHLEQQVHLIIFHRPQPQIRTRGVLIFFVFTWVHGFIFIPHGSLPVQKCVMLSRTIIYYCTLYLFSTGTDIAHSSLHCCNMSFLVRMLFLRPTLNTYADADGAICPDVRVFSESLWIRAKQSITPGGQCGCHSPIHTSSETWRRNLAELFEERLFELETWNISMIFCHLDTRMLQNSWEGIGSELNVSLSVLKKKWMSCH